MVHFASHGYGGQIWNCFIDEYLSCINLGGGQFYFTIYVIYQFVNEHTIGYFLPSLLDVVKMITGCHWSYKLSSDDVSNRTNPV